MRSVLRRLIEEGLSKGNLKVFDELLAPEFKQYQASFVQGVKELKEVTERSSRAFPDQHFEIQDEIRENDRIVCRWTWQGTHVAQFMSWPATNKQVSSSGITIARVSDGKILEIWEEWDFAGFRKQLEG